MTVRMDNVAIVVEDLDAAVAFFAALGLELEGRAEISGEVADRCTGLDGVHTAIAMMRAPDGSGRIELTAYRTPALVPATPTPNTQGFHRVMFQVDDIEETLARLAGLGGSLLGEIANYEDVYRLCYVRGPGGFVIGLAQQTRVGGS